MQKNKEMAGKRIFIEQVRLLYGNATLPLLAALLIGTFLLLVVKDANDDNLLFVWYYIFVIISLARIALVFAYNKNIPASWSKAKWHGWFVAGTYCAGALWGATFFLLFPEESQGHQTVHFLIIVGVAAGGIVFLCPSLPAVCGFLTLILIPMAVKILFMDIYLAPVITALTLVFLMVSLVGSIKINKTISESIQLRLQAVERENVLKESEERYRHIFTTAPLGIFQYDRDSVIVDCNAAFVDILGSTKEKLIGMNMLTTLKNQGVLQKIKESLLSGGSYYEGEYESVTGGKKAPVRAFFTAIRDVNNNISGGVGIVEDFTEKRLSEQQIQYHMTYDSLTGLPNRRLLNHQLQNEIHRARRHGYYGALLFIDMDNFKNINDSLGHSVGDEMLKKVAKRLSQSIRHEDTAARMGGDEFVVILTEIDSDIERTARHVSEVAEAIQYCLSVPCSIEGYELQLTPSIGISLFPKEEMGADDILKQADTAMYRAKEKGRNEIQFFLPSMQKTADERLLMHTELRQALDKDGFVLYFQPQFNDKKEMIGAEALIRWQHPSRGLVPPGYFLEVAEETGIMADIGYWVLSSACQSIRQWADNGWLKEGQVISVNVSGKELNDVDFITKVKQIFEDTGINPAFLGIEITEGSLINTGKEIVDKIRLLRDLGVKFSIDDFGTGYSSLSYLRSLPLHTLKIDRSFVNDIGNRLEGVVLVDTIIMMAQNLGLRVIAEGVENKEEYEYLGKKGCREYQGYYFSRPLTPEKFTEMLIENGGKNYDLSDLNSLSERKG
ncbi:MAG: EAL domain-containing protein [Desulfocapsaceae bacterium]|nr:EAL domain-containing protein [Desulfocapsaceae bacterium]